MSNIRIHLNSLTLPSLLNWYAVKLEAVEQDLQARRAAAESALAVRVSQVLTTKHHLRAVSSYDDFASMMNALPSYSASSTSQPQSQQYAPITPQRQSKQTPAQPEPSATVDLAARDRYDEDASEILRLIKFIRANTMSYDDYANGEVAVKCIELFMLIQKHKLDLLSQMLGPYSGYYETCLYIRKNYTTINEAATVHKSEEEHKRIVAEREQQQAAYNAEQAHQAQQQCEQSARNAALLAGAQQAFAKIKSAQQPATPAQPQPKQAVDMNDPKMQNLLAQLG